MKKIILKRPLKYQLITFFSLIILVTSMFLFSREDYITFSLTNEFWQNLTQIHFILILLYFFSIILLYYTTTFSYIFFFVNNLLLIPFILFQASEYFFKQPVWFIPYLGVFYIFLFILKKDFYFTYFDKNRRGFRKNLRIDIANLTIIDCHSTFVKDISIQGCSLIGGDNLFVDGQEVAFSMETADFFLNCSGTIVHTNGKEYGLQFNDLNKDQKREIKKLFKKRGFQRVYVNIPAKVWNDRISKKVNILNFSIDGCFLELDTEDISQEISENEKIRLEFKLSGDFFVIPATILWINRSFAIQKPTGIGLKFIFRQKGVQKKILKEKVHKMVTFFDKK